MTYLGHEDAWREWRAALGSARMHHAWILAGVAGLGKGAFARAAAAELVSEASIPQPAPGMHPDILIPEHPPENKTEADKRDEGKDFRKKRGIPIDEIRAALRRLETRPTLGARRAIIIDPADDLEKSAANALLKALEEPPAGTYFLLVSHRPGRLLPTIRSRCRILRFPTLSTAEVHRVVTLETPEVHPATIDAAVAAAEGSPGAALAFVAQDLGKIHGVMLDILRQGDDGFALRGALAEEIGARPDRDRLQAVSDLARAVLATRVVDASSPQRQRIVAAHADLVRLAGQLPTYNYDSGLVAMEIGGLLASAAMPRETAA